MGVRVVSMPCWELFRAQPESYKEALLPKSVPKMSVEAAVTMGWGEWADAFVGINVFGASAPGGTCLDRFGFNVPNIVSCAGRCLRGERGALSDGSQAKSKADARRVCAGHARGRLSPPSQFAWHRGMQRRQRALRVLEFVPASAATVCLAPLSFSGELPRPEPGHAALTAITACAACLRSCDCSAEEEQHGSDE